MDPVAASSRQCVLPTTARRRAGPRCSSALFLGALLLLGAGMRANAEERGVLVAPQAAAADPDFALQGEYVAPGVGVQVAAQGDGKFLIVRYAGGLPGAGWIGKDRQEEDDDRAAVEQLIKARVLKKIERRSPTFGAAPPTGSIVLFDGAQQSLRKWQSGARIDDGSLVQGCTTVEKFSDFDLHVEFRLPFKPKGRGQGRGNSGVYLQGRYETQVLDSFALEGKNDECGAIYSIKAPDVNMCLPPLVWQTYDVQFTAARWNAGKKITDARATVRHNGVVVQQNVAIPHATRAAPLGEGPEPGPIHLQDHGDPVRFRNVWLLPRSVEREAKRPIVVGFERFYSGTDSGAEGGRLLLGELNCVSCHKADAAATWGRPKQAPILTEVGKRVRPEYIERYLADPHGVKPGATMPDMLARLPENERREAARALTNFLASTGSPPERSPAKQAYHRGEQAFATIGCLACHLANNANPTDVALTPLGDLSAKYTTASLAAFLKEPHKSRPSGRMPALMHDDQEAMDLATYLVGATERKQKTPNLRFAAYHGEWNTVPDFDRLRAVKAGVCAGFDTGVAGEASNFGVRYEGFLQVDRPGDYTFHLGSDDGSILTIDGDKVVVVDGVHPHTVHSERARLTKGVHPLRVDYFQKDGEATLDLEFEGPGVLRQDANAAIFPTAQGRPSASAKTQDSQFHFEPTEVEKGKKWFASLGCASCHEMKEQGGKVASTLLAPPLNRLRPDAGCLAAAPSPGKAAPNYELSSSQRAALAAALTTQPIRASPLPAVVIARTMTTFNCYACHSRAGVGGPERERNPAFATTMAEMGDEGRVPPPLDGVGDKMSDHYLRELLDKGPKDRPYMLTRMPRFGFANVQSLPAAFAALDRRPAGSPASLPEAVHRTRALGRLLVGDKALGCIKCHTFGPHKITGVQTMDLQLISNRVREDWFRRYLVDPQAYRPGTRMPSSFPKGQSSFHGAYDGDTSKQLTAIWTFLKDGPKAAVPEGMFLDAIELKAESAPLIYRNFIDGLSPRGIAVAYPERTNLAWDAENFCLTLLWRGRFLDASKHWAGRGNGYQIPLGDDVVKLETTAPIAALKSPADAWPTQPPRDRGYRFHGYKLDQAGRPTFQYSAKNFSVEDSIEPVKIGNESSFQRTLTVAAVGPLKDLFFRAAVGAKIVDRPDGSFLVNDSVRLRFPGANAFVRDSAGGKELIAPLIFQNGAARLVEEIMW